ncbi:membrane protein insertase YidC [Mycoplasma zalophi]|uniref:Membrane protein insertase YidC n=1 Tax=Mycoplasma zalophi TaxID=191287 RepID=A0ABS6DPH6_9MOLU|nr:membrane protein insertase YidC [Mycoplasma zalophi]MBU4691042.1 membrane protein insertase YidC [Mycoplasma zalophi]MBU4692178.1 membrane protein insertase YidC [Mycoplasma zalophi]
MPKRTRSKHYDFFNPNHNSNDKNIKKDTKVLIKKIWKWIKILLIVFVIGTGFVGCAQSFGLRSPVKVGTGFETYLKKEDISPNIEVFAYNKDTLTFNRSNNGKIIQDNPYLKADSVEELKLVKEQIKNNQGNMDTYKSQTLGIQIQNSEGKNISGNVYNQNGKFIIYAKGDESGNGAVKNYDNVTTWTNIYNIQNLEWTRKKVQNNGVEIEVKDRIKDIRISVLPNYILDTSLESKFSRDTYQALIDESARLFKNEMIEAKLNSQDENSKSYWDVILEYANISNTATALETINSFIKKLAEKKDQPLTDSEISVITKVESFIHSNTIEYGNLTGLSFVSNNTNNEGYNIVTFKNISDKGNYINNNSTLLNSLFGEPHRPIATWAEYWEFGPFYGLFVYPINQLLGGIINGISYLGGWSVIIGLIITVIVTKLIVVAISYKSIFASQKQQELNAKKAKIEAKYAPYKGDKQMEQKKKQEINEMYKKNHANPFTAMISSLIAMPILIVMFRIVQGSPEIKHSVWYGIQMSATSYQNLLAGEYKYLPIILISVLVQLVAQMLPKFLSRKKDKLRTNVYEREALRKSNKMQNIITMVFVGFGVIFQAGLQIYWIITGIWQIMQTLVVWKIERTDFYKTKIVPRL